LLARGSCEESDMPTTFPVTRPAIGILEKVLAIIGDGNFVAVTGFSTAGLLLTILFTRCVMLRFPDLGILIEQYNQF
jgi:hypothetical protein